MNCDVVPIPLPGLPLGAASDAAGATRRVALDAFLAGPENRLAEVAVGAALDAALDRYNPLLFHGPSGVGKSHLALGIAGAWRARHGRRARVECVVATDFARELNDAIAAQATDDFRAKYRHASLLVFEDVTRLAGKQAAQEELLHTFDALLANGGRLIATATVAPKDWTDILPSLAARLRSGLVVPLKLPNQAVRSMILDRLAQLCQMAAPREVLDLLAAELAVSVPELLGAMVQLVSTANDAGQPLALAHARRWLAQRNGARRPALRQIAEATARQFQLKLSLLRGPSRRRAVVLARDAAIYLARELGSATFPEIGRYFGGRDHTTVQHGYRKMLGLLESEPAMRQALEEVEKVLMLC